MRQRGRLVVLLSVGLAFAGACRSSRSASTDEQEHADELAEDELAEDALTPDDAAQANMEAPAEAAARPPAPDPLAGYSVVPPRSEGTFDEMWLPLRGAGELYTPVMDLELPKDPELNDYSLVKWEELRSKQLVMQRTIDGKTSILHVAYSDARLIDAGTPYQPVEPVAFLMWALSDPTADGVFFNARTRVCSVCVPDRAYGINAFYVAELIGYLKTVPDDGSRPFSELAVLAEQRSEYWQVLSYAGRSFREPRPGDDWRAAELSKLRAYWTLDFPRSRARAVDELEWFIKEHGATPERRELLAWFKERHR